jgi:hypothetical protein
MRRYTLIALVLSCCGAAAAQAPSFRGLGRPAGAQLDVGVGAVSDDGASAVGAYQVQSMHPTILDSVGVLWRSSGTIQSVPSGARGITPDGLYIYGTTVTPPMIMPTAWRWSVATQVTMRAPDPWTYWSWGQGLTTDGQLLLCGVDLPPYGALLVRNGAADREIVPPASFSLFNPTSMSGDAGVVAGTVWSQATASVPMYWRDGQFATIGPAGIHPYQVIVSRDGTAFTGTYDTPAGERGFRADRHGHFAPLGMASFAEHYAHCISGDGSVIGGGGWHAAEQRWRAILWTRAAGTRDLKAVLLQMGLTEVVPWRLLDVMGVSGDGAWMVGNGINPAGLSEPWIARIPPFCYANCDISTGTPVLSIADFTCFLTRFANGDAYTNCDDSTAPPVLNVVDFNCFLQRYAAGCAQ